MPFVFYFCLSEGGLTQWNNAGSLLYNILNAKRTIDLTADQLLIIERISIVIQRRLSLDEYNWGNRLPACLEDVVQAQSILASKRGQSIPYKYKLAHEDDSKYILVNPPSDRQKSKAKGTSSGKSRTSDKAFSDIQSDAPADPGLEEEVTTEIEDLTIDEPVIEPITAKSLKRSYREAFSQL